MRCDPPKPPTPARLGRLVDHYIKNWRPRTGAERARFRAMPDLKRAIRIAALARREDGKCESHQRQVGNKKLRAFERSLQRIRPKINGCADFDELYDLIWSHRIPGVGPVTVYDTAHRISMFLGCEPKPVYLHAGVRVGARRLGLPRTTLRLERSELPRELRRLKSDDVENFLCIYKAAFLSARASLSACQPARRTGCRTQTAGVC